jgi:putative tricarboxylic transport membrane protein
MKNRNLISGVFFLGIGIIISIYAFTYGIGGSVSPGPGFLPLLTGICLVLLSLILLLSTLKDNTTLKEKTEKFFPEKESFKKISLSILGLILYTVALEYFGYVLTTLLFMIFMLKCIESRNRITVLLWSSLTAISFYLLFEMLLKSQLPKGILGI